MSILPPIEEVPAAHLVGRVLPGGWTVTELVNQDPGGTGGCFSVPYFVTSGAGEKAFLKALNFQAAATGPGDIVERLNTFTETFKFERDLLGHCRERRLSRVVRMLDSGTVEVAEAGPLLSQVPYMIFELADGDIRAFQSRMTALDTVWAFRVMKHAIQGVGQLHAVHTAHQDLKPSNVLTQDAGSVMKLGDLGRADRRGVDGPFSEEPIPGAWAYAPPEQLYGAFGRTWEERRAGDLYLAGSLGVQLFLGHCLSVLVQQGMPREFRFDVWRGDFAEILPYLVHSHQAVMAELRSVVLQATGHEDSTSRFVEGVTQLTAPDPRQRGHAKDRASAGSSYGVARFVSLMDLLATREQYRLLTEA